jgi:hypothetical protein
VAGRYLLLSVGMVKDPRPLSPSFPRASVPVGGPKPFFNTQGRYTNRLHKTSDRRKGGVPRLGDRQAWPEATTMVAGIVSPSLSAKRVNEASTSASRDGLRSGATC